MKGFSMELSEPMCCKAVCCSNSQIEGKAAMHDGQRNISSLRRDGWMRPTSRIEVGREGKGRAKGVEDRLLWVLDGRSKGELEGRSISTEPWKRDRVRI
jgi:hypothetical protein